MHKTLPAIVKWNRRILVIGNHFTYWYEAIPLPDKKAFTTANALVENWISRFGCPLSLHSHNGHNFKSRVFERIIQFREMSNTKTTTFHPQ